jgi:hypothetical protein
LGVVSKRLIGVGKSKLFRAYSDAKGSLFRLLLRLYHAMLDIILIMCLVVVVVA